MNKIVEYSPPVTAYAARCTPTTLRTWRRMGFFKSLGERKGKGHVFTLSDVARIAIAAFIAQNGASLREAFEIVEQRGGMIDAVAAAVRDEPGSAADYYLSLTIDPDVSFPASITGADIAHIEFAAKPVAVLQVNVSELLRSVLRRLSVGADSWHEVA